MIDAVLTFLANLLPVDFSHSDPVRVAYRRAYRSRGSVAGMEVDEAPLIAEMKQAGVPGIYGDPYPERVIVALGAWRAARSPKELNALLRG